MQTVMNVINTVFGIPLGYVMYFCYHLVGNYGLAILLFTLISKVILFPLSLVAQKNSIRMVAIQPMLDEIKLRYAGDKDRIAEEQLALYKRENYKPSLGCLPTLIQLPLIFGLLNVIYNPLQHLLHIGRDAIAALEGFALQLTGLENLGFGAQQKIIDMIHADPAAFEPLRGSLPDFDGVMAAIHSLDMHFLGLDLSQIPGFAMPLLLIPILSALSALALCLAQNRINVLQREQGAASQWGMAIFLVAFSGYFAFVVPAGIGLYWIAGNLLSIVVMALCNVVYNPRKYIDYDSRPQRPQLSKAEKAAQKQEKTENRARERADDKRFYADENEPKQLVFYSAGSGFYKYFKNTIEYILANSELVIHYVTSDPNDRVFQMDMPRILPYYIGDKRLIPFMMKMDADMVVMTMPDLETFHIKRSLVRKDVEYLYIFHTVASMHMTLREGAVDHYDTVFCVGPHQEKEIRKTEKLYALPPKTLVDFGYSVIDDLVDAFATLPPRQDSRPQILIGPSWQADNLMELCLDEVMEQLLGQGWHIILRPHPEFIKRFPQKMAFIRKKYADVPPEELTIETDFSSNTSIYQSDVLITDWSNIAFEFSYCTLRPCVFINTPMKVMNPEYKRLGIEPLDITLRDEVGVSVDPSKLDGLRETVAGMLANKTQYADKITEVRGQYLYNLGHSGEVGSEYIIEALKKKPKRPEL